MSGIVKDRSIERGATVLAVLTGQRGYSRPVALRLSPPEVPDEFQPLVAPTWTARCSFDPGTTVQFSIDEAGAVIVLEKAAQEPGGLWKLCFSRTYFDLGQKGRPLRATSAARAAGMAMRFASEYKPDLSFWISGSSAQVLASYDTPRVLVAGARAKGDDALEHSIETIRKIGLDLAADRLLVRALPVTYSSHLHAPVGGGWPYFVTAIYREGPSRRMLEVFKLQN